MNKDYVIWLEGGECLEGTINDETAEHLKAVFSEDPPSTQIIEFNDSDGEVMICCNKIMAIGLNQKAKNIEVRGLR